MGLFDMVRGQLIDVIEWTDDSSDTLVHKYDMNGKEIMMGAQLTVRESQAAVFVDEGRLADVFAPGRYELSTRNLPVLTALRAWQFGFNSPFQSDVYFVSTRQFLDRKWGTANPVMMRDSELGMIRLRAFGSFAFRVSDPAVFMREVFGTAALFTAAGVEGQIRSLAVSALSDAIAQSGIPALDLASKYDELSRLATHYGFIDSGHMVKEMSAAELDAACRKCIRVQVSDIQALTQVLDKMALEYSICSDTMADIFAKINVTELALALADQGCDIISLNEREESLESYYVNLIGGGNHHE